MRKYNLTVVFLLSLLCCFFIAPIHSALTQSAGMSISSSGSIIYGGNPGLILKYGTDFEDAVKVDDHYLNLPIDHYFNFQGEGGARMWVEDGSTGPIPHSGSRCIGMELTDITQSRRCQFELLHMQSLTEDELFVSVWLYLPADWQLYASGVESWTRWYEIANPLFDGFPSFEPYIEVHVIQPELGVQTFDLKVSRRDNGNVEYPINEISDFPLTRGRWFNLKYYVVRHETDGVVKVWIDGISVANGSGLDTKGTSTFWYTITAKIYYNPIDTTPHQLWVDDLEIYGTP